MGGLLSDGLIGVMSYCAMEWWIYHCRNVLWYSSTGGFSDPWGDNTAAVDPPPIYATVNKSKKVITNDPWATPAVTNNEPPQELFSSDPLPSDFVTPTMDPWGSSVTTSQPTVNNDELVIMQHLMYSVSAVLSVEQIIL